MYDCPFVHFIIITVHQWKKNVEKDNTVTVNSEHGTDKFVCITLFSEKYYSK